MDAGRLRLNLSAAGASIATALALVALKLWAQMETGALSVAASLADSALDLLVSLGNLAAILYAARPADEDHRFGHTAAEDVAALLQAGLVIAAGLAVFASGAWRLVAPRPLEAEGLGLGVMLVSLALTGALILWQQRVARRTGSRVVAADRAHYLADFAPGLAAVAALAGAGLFGLERLDPILAMAAALWILRTGVAAGRPALGGLMDREADPTLAERVGAIAAQTPGLAGVHDLRTRTSGSKLFLQLHAEIDGELSLREAHEIGEDLRRRLLTLDEEVDVIIHKDPA